MSEGWRDIGSAPKDGTAVWLLVEGHPYIGYWDPDDAPWAEPKWFIKATFKRRDRDKKLPDDICGCYAHGVAPTAWQPLPLPA